MIHYHGMTGVGTTDDIVKFAKSRNCFVSYAYKRYLPTIASVCSSFALDNGAFTAWNKNENFDFVGYNEFVDLWKTHPAFDWAIIPDKIDGTEDENDQLIKDWKFPDFMSVPVYHLHESTQRLERLINRFPIIAFGSSGDFSTPGNVSWWDRMEWVMKTACNSQGVPRAKYHGLRMLDSKIFSRIPLKSADSTTAERNGLYEWKFGQFAPATRGQRNSVVADKIESQQSTAIWVESKQEELVLE